MRTLSAAMDEPSPEHAAVFAAAIAAPDPEQRRAVLANALQRHGHDLLESLLVAAAAEEPEGPVMVLLGEAAELVAEWIHGTDVTGTAEEAERRRLAADAMVALVADGEGDPLTTIAAELTLADALLGLPSGHPERDLDSARVKAHNAWRLAGELEDPAAELAALHVLIGLPDHDHAAFEQLIAAYRALHRRVPYELRRHFAAHAGQAALGHAADARRERRRDDERAWLSLAGAVLRPMTRRRRLSGDEQLVLGAYLFARGRLREAAALAAQAGDGGALLAAQAEARLGHARNAEVALRRVIDGLRERYLQSVDHDDVERRGSALRMATSTLAWALAAQGQWAEALSVLEGAKSVRLHFRRALRDAPGGQRALELEGALHAVARGVPVTTAALAPQDESGDPIGRSVSAHARLTEAYRQARETLAPTALSAPDLAELASVLEPAEAALVIGVTPVDTMLLLVCPDDVEAPRACRLVANWSFERWSWLLIGEQEDGWLSALAGVPGVDRGRSLARLIGAVEEALGPALRELLAQVSARRLVVIPHATLHLVPLWALPALDGRDVLICPSARHFIAARRALPSTAASALLVADPTLDLPLSALEAAALKRHLHRVRELARADESDVRQALPGAWLLHVSGHGRLDIADPDSAGLMLAPTRRQRELLGDVLAASSAADTTWVTAPQAWEVADVHGLGRLSRRRVGARVELRLDSGPTETLWIELEDGTVRLAGELWSAGDIVVEPSLTGTALAFLSACEAGAAPAGSAEESAGLLAALLLAGVPTIVSTLWPVTEELAALAVDLFFEAFAAAPSPPNAAALTGALGRRLRTLDRDEACRRLSALAALCPDAHVQFITEATVARIAAGPRHPFDGALHWAAFFAAGGGIINAPGARRA